MRKPLIAANWKMNPPPAGFDAKDSPFRSTKTVDVIVFPTFVDLQACLDAKLDTGAQCAHAAEKGAHTGDVSVRMLKKLGCSHVLCGHSERRQEHGETDVQIAMLAATAIRQGVQPVVCVGESREERESGQAKDVVKRQVETIVASTVSGSLIFAYEPVWAIGTGTNATPEETQEMHAFIRSLLPDAIRDKTPILYGGSITPACAQALFALQDVDGGLVGGASLKPEEFKKIVEIAGKSRKA